MEIVLKQKHQRILPVCTPLRALVRVHGTEKQPDIQLFSFGQNRYNELLLGHSQDRFYPTLVEWGYGKDVKEIAAGNEISVLLTASGNLTL